MSIQDLRIEPPSLTCSLHYLTVVEEAAMMSGNILSSLLALLSSWAGVVVWGRWAGQVMVLQEWGMCEHL
jgi:hypothetical protein